MASPVVLARSGVEDVDVGHELVGDPAVVETGRAGVIALVESVLLEVAALEVHGPDVHRAVAVAQEIDPVLPDHRILAGPGVVGRQRDGLFAAEDEGPQVLGRAALVALRVTALEREPGEEERLACRIERSVGRLVEGKQGLGVRLGVEDNELGVGQGRKFLRRVEDLAIGSPAGDRRRLPGEGAADGETSGEGHGVDFGRPLVLGGEGQGQAVGRNGRISFHPRVRGQTAGRPAPDVDRPQVALRSEDDDVAVDSWKTVVAVPSGGEAGLGETEETEDGGGED